MPTQQYSRGHQMQDSDTSRCIANCLETLRSCLETLHYCLEEKGTAFSGKHIELLQTCVETCNLSVRLMAADSEFHPQACGLCSEVCEACAVECDRFEDDEVFQRCAEACRRSAESCRGMAGTTIKISGQNRERGSHLHHS